ncbi:MAG: hypothetical protein LBQ26_01925 [Holosporales bacterium]|jgi:hypothetical protein|nr:hypothetical protein [Holosporales bacterium]
MTMCWKEPLLGAYVALVFTLDVGAAGGGGGPASEDVWLDPSHQEIAIIPVETDTLTFSSAYFEPLYTNKGLAVFGSDLLRLLIRGEDYWRFKSFWVKLGYYCLGTYITSAFRTAYHEVGHGLRSRAYGYDYQLMFANDTDPMRKDENFFKFFVRDLLTLRRGACRSNALASSPSQNKRVAIVAAGGMNNNAYFAEAMSDDLYRRQDVHFFEGVNYICGQLYAAAYAAGAGVLEDDPIHVEANWRILGVPAAREDMQRASCISFLLSATTYRTLFAIWNELVHTGRQTGPFSIYGFRVPDIFSYTTSKGMSYKLVSEYKVRDGVHILFGCEHVGHGLPATEVNVGLEYDLGESWRNLSCKGVLTFGQGLNVEAACTLPILERLLATLGGALYSRDSLLGERHAPDLRKKYSGTIYLSFSLKY